MGYGTDFWMFVLMDIIVGVGMVIWPIVLLFWRKIKVATAKRRGLYECHIHFPSKIVETKWLPLKNGKIEYSKGGMHYMWTVLPQAVEQTSTDAMPTLNLSTEKDTALAMVGSLPPNLTAHAQKISASALEILAKAGFDKKSPVVLLLIIVLILSIIGIALGAMALQNTAALTSPQFTHFLAQQAPTS